MNLDSFTDKIKKVNGTFGDVGGCNEWAAFFSTYTLVMIAVLKNVNLKKIQRYFLNSLTIGNFLVLLFSFSRGGYLAFLSGLLYLLIRLKKFVPLLLLLLLPIFYTVVLPTSVVERIEMSFAGVKEEGVSEEALDPDINSRLIMWNQALELFSESPVIGHGLLTFRYRHWRNPHNEHLHMLVQGGIVGYFLFVWLFWASFKEARTLNRVGASLFFKKLGLGMQAAIISLFIANLFGDRWSYYVLTGYFWVLNAIVFLAINHSLSMQEKGTLPKMRK